MNDWFTGYTSECLLSEGAKITLRMFTEEEWCQQIPYSVKLNTLKLTVAQSYDMWFNYLNTGYWEYVHND